tara:strand:+ start:2195 stop:7711 length:5517 start_codon:yes stop_codon:yes gene_type:complete
MAEKHFIKGLFKDTAPIDQIEGSWRYARNAVVAAVDGAISNEGGTSLTGYLGDSSIFGTQEYKAIGAIEVDNDRTVIFVTDIVNTLDITGIVPSSEIGIWENNVYTVLYRPDVSATVLPHDLKLRETHPIQGTFKIDSKGDLIVYFTDDLNTPRAFNVARQQRSIAEGNPISWLYAIDPQETHANHIDLLNLFPSSGPVPRVSLEYIINLSDTPDNQSSNQSSIIEGGGLRTGVYYLALAYVDADFVATNYLTVANPVSIVPEFDHTRPTTRKSGFKDGGQTSKAIKWTVSNLNTDYQFIRPVIIRKMGGVKEAFQLNDVDLSVAIKAGIVYSGTEGSATSSVEEVIIDTTSYETAKTIRQLDGILYLGNLTGSKDVGYQKYANNISLDAVVHPIPDFDTIYATVDNFETGFGTKVVDMGYKVDETRSYRWAPNIFKYKGYTRDEVYAFYIAFVMNDGSMSYAYHIPGRKALSQELSVLPFEGESNEIARDLRDLSKQYSRNFHFYDYSDTVSTTLGMQYWENATEFYPQTDNFEVWNEYGILDSLKGSKVRHHHFPSNSNEKYKTILGHNSEHFESDGTSSVGGGIEPTGFTNVRESCDEDAFTEDDDSWATFQNLDYEYSGDLAAASAYFENGTFTALTDIQVSVKALLWFTKKNGNSTNQPVEARILRRIGGAVEDLFTTGEIPTNGFTNDYGGCWDQQDVAPLFLGEFTDGSATQSGWGEGGAEDYFQQPLEPYWANDYSGTTGCATPYINLSAGDTIQIECRYAGLKGDDIRMIGTWNQDDCPGTSGYDFNITGCNSISPATMHKMSYVSFFIRPQEDALLDTELYSDVKVSHEVQRLGFNLADIKIPRDIADIVQGFRIFYAKREHVNRRILGQSLLMPMQQHRAVIGICQEAQDATTPGLQTSAATMQVLQSLTSDPEEFYNVDPWPLASDEYPPYETIFNDQVGAYEHDSRGYKNFSFHDFTMLKHKGSIAGATHIKPEYVVVPYVWNGPGITQNRRMNTVIANVEADDGEPLIIKELWGYDASTCYPKEMYSVITMGVNYLNSRFEQEGTGSNSIFTYSYPRILSQKSKTYLLGDTIFRGQSLGFGGKLFNEFGVSCAAFGLRDKHELPTLSVNPDSPSGEASYRFGVYYPLASPMLVNENVDLAYDASDATDPWHRMQMYLINLHAFKTDVYKSLDSQTLVWTGFEVLGDELENFIFEADGSPNTFTNKYGVFDANYSIATLQAINNTPLYDTGIFGGDTFIARYAFASALKPSTPALPSKPKKAVHSVIVESTDNIAFRHMESDKSLYFPGTPVRDILRQAGSEDGDYSHFDNLTYNTDYSSVNDIRPAFPLPLKTVDQDDFSTRTHRSAKDDTTSLIDNFRIFLANQYKDLPKNRGELWSLASFNNLLYFHMEDSLFATKGKQSMGLSDGTQAFIGGGDIFEQEPDEVIQTEGGFGGTQSQWAVLTTRYGYFFVDVNARKVFLMGESMSEISGLGMRQWFNENLKFNLEDYGYSGYGIDNPIQGMGMHATWDPRYKRILLTKRDLVPTAFFIEEFESGVIRFDSGLSIYEVLMDDVWVPLPLSCEDHKYFTCDGWTISYYPALGVWGGFHDYQPYLYFNTSTDFYSFTDQYERSETLGALGLGTVFGNVGIWQHNVGNKGVFYQEVVAEETPFPFEFEVIHNEHKSDTAVLASLNYTLETFTPLGVNILDHGFTSFFLYNTFQNSGESMLDYLINIRRVGNNWKVNNFRDLAAIAVNTSPYYMSTAENVAGGTNMGTVTTSSIAAMFTVSGMSEVINAAYLDLNKNWNQKKKFIDKWVGIRLIYSNVTNNSLNLYSTNVSIRKMYR